MYLWDLQVRGRPDSSMINSQITTLSRLEKIYGATDIWGNQWSWLTISPDRCALSIPSDFWIDTLSKYQKKEVLIGGVPTPSFSQQTDIRTTGTIGATDHYKKRLLNVASTISGILTLMESTTTEMRAMKEQSKWTSIPFGKTGEHFKNMHK